MLSYVPQVDKSLKQSPTIEEIIAKTIASVLDNVKF